MDDFELSDLEKETNDSHNTIRYKEKENAFKKIVNRGLFSLIFAIKLGESMTDMTDREGHDGLTEVITM